MTQTWNGRSGWSFIVPVGLMLVFFIVVVAIQPTWSAFHSHDIQKQLGVLLVGWIASPILIGLFVVMVRLLGSAVLSMDDEKMTYKQNGGQSSLAWADVAWINHDRRAPGGGSFLNLWARPGWSRTQGGPPADPNTQAIGIALAHFKDDDAKQITDTAKQHAQQVGAQYAEDQPPPWTTGPAWAKDKDRA
jgi:hypothetical protein